MRLNGWQRIGVVASVIWAIGGAIWGNNLGIQEGDWVVREYKFCLARHSVQPDGTVPQDTDWGPCTRAFEKDYPAAVGNHWLYAAVFGLVPIPLGWLVVYGLVALWRWIRVGFKPR